VTTGKVKVANTERGFCFITLEQPHVSGKRCTPKVVNAALDDWCEEWGVSAEEITIHGLRATKIFDLRSAGVSDGAIADEIGMSVSMVSRYLRFSDKAASARASRDRRERKATGFENSGGI
jgi:integrase